MDPFANAPNTSTFAPVVTKSMYDLNANANEKYKLKRLPGKIIAQNVVVKYVRRVRVRSGNQCVYIIGFTKRFSSTRSVNNVLLVKRDNPIYEKIRELEARLNVYRMPVRFDAVEFDHSYNILSLH